MRARSLGLPLVSLGTAEFDGAQLTNVTRMALAMGYVGIDNDDGGRGTDMGNTLRELAVPRDKFFLTAKVNGGQTKAQTAAELGQKTNNDFLLKNDQKRRLLQCKPEPD